MEEHKHEHKGHEIIECLECEGEVEEVEEKKPWYKQLRVILLGVSGLFTLTGALMNLLGVPSPIPESMFGIAILTGGFFPAKLGIQALGKLTLNINTLLITATLGAVILDLWEEAGVLVFVFSLGSILETYAVDKARDSVGALVKLMPRQALIIKDDKEFVVDADDVKINDVILIKPGEKVPLDGYVISGTSNIDEAAITGEPVPVFKKTGDNVFAGTINQRGTLDVRVTSLAADTTLARIIHSIEEHQSRRSSYQRFGEKFGRMYTPIMFIIALGVAVIPVLLGAGDIESWFYRALVVLVVSCSCGIALSVPVAVVAAISHAARHGVLFKGGSYLEIGRKINTLVFDKTRTLTTGKPKVTDILPLNGQSRESVLSFAASIETRSEHPLAESIVEMAKEEGVPFIKPTEFFNVPGMGARATIDGTVYHIGNERLFLAHKMSFDHVRTEIQRLEDEGKTLVFVVAGESLTGIIAIADQLRPEARNMVDQLKKMGLKVVMLTGDHEQTARVMAAAAGIDEFKSMLMPEDKVTEVEKLSRDGNLVAMVGDGINDAPAMAAAGLGIAMGAGTDVAIETGDVALLTDDLSRVPFIFRLSRRTVDAIRFNIAVSLIIVLILVPAALLGIVDLVPGLLLNEASAILVILNGLRLLR